MVAAGSTPIAYLERLHDEAEARYARSRHAG